LSLRFLYNLEGRVTLVGAENRIELWNPEDWRVWLGDPTYGQDSEDLWFEIEMQMKHMQAGREIE
jgi:DNA-binding transcriptional regulator/RsmH inhibitor MraZ